LGGWWEAAFEKASWVGTVPMEQQKMTSSRFEMRADRSGTSAVDIALTGRSNVKATFLLSLPSQLY